MTPAIILTAGFALTLVGAVVAGCWLGARCFNSAVEGWRR